MVVRVPREATLSLGRIIGLNSECSQLLYVLCFDRWHFMVLLLVTGLLLVILISWLLDLR